MTRMKSYLSLIPISAKVHRRQNRMTLLCIVFAVFMVTAIFSMADMAARMEQSRLMEKHGGLSYTAMFSGTWGQTLLLTAGILFLLILLAGVLMISGSINSSVAQRTKYFGTLRCIGMSTRQVMWFVRLEALNWCKTAIPIGIAFGIVSSWALCAVLRFFVKEEFTEIPLFGISPLGIISGILVGVLSVLWAAESPAKRASRVSPLTAVSGNAAPSKPIRTAEHMGFFKIETSLGIRHAVSAGKNLLLLTASFALSIILFLSFSVLIELVDHLIPQSAASPDMEIWSSDGTNSISGDLVRTLSGMEGVRRVYGRRSVFDVPAEMNDNAMLSGSVDLVSFDDFDLNALKKDGALRRGSDLSKVYGSSSYVLAAWDPNCLWKAGDTVIVGNETLTIAGLLKYDPFSANGLTNGKLTLITSNETFVRLTGITDYSLVLIQTEPGITEEDAAAIGKAAEEYGGRFFDDRDQRTSGTYFAFVTCCYTFLGIIALVSVLNIVNSIAMSVSARVRQYGAMRAVGMDDRQVTKMIIAEALTYALLGCVTGCGIGLLLSRFLYGFLITGHFPYAVWSPPVGLLTCMILFVVGAALIAALGPAKRIRNLSITETISEL